MVDWKYGDVIRRAVTMQPLVYSHLMVIGPSNSPDRVAALVLDNANDLLGKLGGVWHKADEGAIVFPIMRDWELADEDWDLPF